ncbi:YcxB family protein [Flavobacteriaceae bacterium SZ-1-7]|uniref:YcxB family protein n=1 Tax=Tamlana sedimenti TaxID=3134126 RepID=UPI003128FF0E
MIQTKNYILTKKDYAKIIISKRIKKSWWLYAIMIVMGLIYLPSFGKDSFSSFFVLFAFIYPIAIVIYLWVWAYSKGHEPIFSETKLSFDDNFLYFEQSENETKLSPGTIQNIVSNNDYLLLYISKGRFIYIPKNIFYSTEDFNKFSSLINRT